MCGLVAILSKKSNGFTQDEGAMLNISMMLNQVRGDDSTGLVCIDNKNNWSYIKSVGGVKSLVSHKDYDDFRKVIMNDGRLVMGHGRAATRGTVTVENAHPFHIKEREGEIIFMHNGTLHSYQTLGSIYQHAVDSEYLGTMIARHGAEKALSEIDGAMAVMWWDIKEQTFNFYRNTERPLHYMISKSGEIYLNSEKWVLEFLNHRYKLGIPDKDIYQLQDMIHNSYKVNGKHAGELRATKIVKAVKTYSRGVWGAGGKYSDYLGDSFDAGMYGVQTRTMRTPYDDTPPPEDKEFWDRDIDTIEWKDGNKVIIYRDRHITTEVGKSPPEADLVRMYEVKHSGDVMKAYQRPGASALHYVCLKYTDHVKEKALREPAKQEKGKVITLHAPKPHEVKFTTRAHNNAKVKHTGVILPGNSAPHLQRYANTTDGGIEIGQVKQVEVCYSEALEKSPQMLRVVCAEVKEKQDMYIDYVFYTSDFTKEQIDKTRFFGGVIGSITMANRDYALANGAYAIAGLCQVQPIQEPESNATAAAVEAPAAQGSSSIH